MRFFFPLHAQEDRSVIINYSCRVDTLTLAAPQLAKPDRIQNNTERQREETEDKRAGEGPGESHFEQKVLVIGSAELKFPLSALWTANKQGATMASRFSPDLEHKGWAAVHPVTLNTPTVLQRASFLCRSTHAVFHSARLLMAAADA